MKIYLVTRTDMYGYDEYDSAVVIEKSPKKAMQLCEFEFGFTCGKMICEFVGYAAKSKKIGESVLGSFNAG